MRLTEIAHHYLNAHLQPGDYAIDATAGNGHDTVHMASLVGPGGHIIGVDIQEAAINATRARLKTYKYLDQVLLIKDEHSKILQSLASKYAQTVSAITFNLGYLPGSEKQIQTTAETTLRALDASRKLLNTKGLLLVTAYRGHKGGQTEADGVARWMQSIEPNGWYVKIHNPEAKKDSIPPILWAASKSTLKSAVKSNKKVCCDPSV